MNPTDPTDSCRKSVTDPALPLPPEPAATAQASRYRAAGDITDGAVPRSDDAGLV